MQIAGVVNQALFFCMQQPENPLCLNCNPPSCLHLAYVVFARYDYTPLRLSCISILTDPILIKLEGGGGGVLGSGYGVNRHETSCD